MLKIDSEKKMFQFHKVRLKVYGVMSKIIILDKFQFHKVRLKVPPVYHKT